MPNFKMKVWFSIKKSVRRLENRSYCSYKFYINFIIIWQYIRFKLYNTEDLVTSLGVELVVDIQCIYSVDEEGHRSALS